MSIFISPQSERSERRGRSIFAGIVSEWVSNWLLWQVSKGLLWSYIIIVSGMGDDVPILGAVVTLLKADGLSVPKASEASDGDFLFLKEL